MNHKLIPAVAGFLILVTILGMTPGLSYAQVVTFGPQLQVTTIPQDDQFLKKGIMILGLDSAIGKTHGTTLIPEFQCLDPVAWAAAVKANGGSAVGIPPACNAQDLMSQHKLLVTYNGLPVSWHVGSTEPQPVVKCNFLEKDKVNVVADPKTGKGKQGPWENLMTTTVDVSNYFVCKPRWKQPAPGVYESSGVLDVYYTGVFDGHFIADTILVVEVTLTLGKTLIFGSDIQDICVLGWAVGLNGFAVPDASQVQLPFNNIQGVFFTITKPDGTVHWVWVDALNGYVSCENAALIQKQVLGILPAVGPDPLSKV